MGEEEKRGEEKKRGEKKRCFHRSGKLRGASSEETICTEKHKHTEADTQTHNRKQAFHPCLDAVSPQCEIPADVKQRDEIRRQTARLGWETHTT